MGLGASVTDLSLDDMSDDDLDKLAAKLGIDPGEDDEDTTTDAGRSDEGDKTPKEEDGSQAAPKPESSGEKLTGQRLLEQFQTDPEAQKLVRAQLDNWLKEASASADTKREQDEFQKLVDSGDFEEIGRRYVETDKQKKVASQVEEQATLKAYGEVYGQLFKQLETFTLTDDEKAALQPEKYESDAAYVLALSDAIAQKKVGQTVDERVTKTVDEKLTTLKNMKSAARATDGSVSNLPGGLGGSAGEVTSSRGLIQEGFREILEEAANTRVGE